ncbi:MAG: hypothetical protein K2K97_03865, partial [Muribaculaceae bacterium]|nr:hypothetical protein [Muribaculaceae bacterium]
MEGKFVGGFSLQLSLVCYMINLYFHGGSSYERELRGVSGGKEAVFGNAFFENIIDHADGGIRIASYNIA